MNTLTEIEAVVDTLPLPQQKALLRHLTERLQNQEQIKRRWPFVAATGQPIRQQEIDDALDAD